jgi:hypothetical protein
MFIQQVPMVLSTLTSYFIIRGEDIPSSDYPEGQHVHVYVMMTRFPPKPHSKPSRNLLRVRINQ